MTNQEGDPGPMAPKGAQTNRKRVFLVKSDPDAASESMSKRKKTSVMNPKSVNQASHREYTRTRESTKKLPSSASRTKGKKAPQSRGKGQQSRSRAKISVVKSSPRATSLVKGRRGQKLSKKGDHNINVSVNSKKKGSTRKVKKEEQPASFAKTPLKKSQHEKITAEKKEVLSPPPGGSLKSTLTAKGRNQRPSAQKNAGSPRGTGRNPRRVKAM